MNFVYRSGRHSIYNLLYSIKYFEIYKNYNKKIKLSLNFKKLNYIELNEKNEVDICKNINKSIE
jgi:hypothetical protein